MSSKTSANIAQVSTPDEIRNVVLVGSSGSGKTTLLEHILRSRITGYRGEKEDLERTSQMMVAAIPAGEVVVNLLDAPGHPDFVGELRAGLRGADAAVFVVAAADGIDSATAALWNECAAVDLPRAIVITKLDDGRTTFADALAALQDTLGKSVQPSYAPLEVNGQIAGNISLVSQRVHDYSSGKVEKRTATDEEIAIVEAYRAALIEGIIEESEDADLMDRYLEGDVLRTEELVNDLLVAVKNGRFFPVIPVTSVNGLGTEELLAVIESSFPTPDSHRLDVTTPDGDEAAAEIGNPDGPLVAEVIRTTSDQFAGRLSVVRIFNGTLSTDDIVRVAGNRSLFTGKEDPAHPDHAEEERIGQMTIPVGLTSQPITKAIAGQIVLLPKLGHAETSDTLSSRDKPLLIAPWTAPEPLLPVAIKAASRNDEDKLPNALARLAVEDTTVRVERTVETDQIVLWTMGQAHIDLLLNRLKERYGVSVTTEDLKVPLRETFVASAKAMGRHVKQSGGHGQYAVCQIEVEPLGRGEGFKFVDKVVGGAVPRQFIPSVEKGVRAQLEKGVIAGYPVVDLQVTLYDGKAHSVDSSDMAFQLAGQHALKEAASAKTVTLLEPIDEVTVVVGDEHMGAVMTDLTSRRGRLLGTDTDAANHAIIKALVPASELSKYAIDLRGLAQGSGSFTREFHGYEQLPANLVDAAIKEHPQH
ncbi:MAG TPA: elongation factor G-like protein EF-G2 [Propionibacteriaceae bacterium]|nr:elongation factor G-like protein EF-G2 [Propionibacteriaceae bacterium]HQE31696.1 elongation factor G-like protein EF-G2 [Propionibacteriaceae bacterium]